MRALPVAAAAALALLAACVVDTDKYKPTTDAECAATDPTTKACGYKCVSASDPATGCATSGVCTPCEGADPSHHVVATCVAGACKIVCEYGWGNCNGNATDGCESPIFASDASNCGGCGRTCGGATPSCVAGSCSGAEWGSFTSPRGLVNDGGAIFVADPGMSGGSITDYNGTALANATGLGQVRWLAAVSGQNKIIATGTTGVGSAPQPWGTTCATAAGGVCFTISEISSPGPSATVVTHTVAPAEVIGDHMEGIAAAGAVLEYFFTFAGSDTVWAWDTAANRTWYTYDNTDVTMPIHDVTGPKGLASYGGRVYFGTSEGGGNAWWVQPTGTGYSPGQVVGGAGRPTHVAVYAEPGFFGGEPFLFWISGDDGSVHATLASGTSGIATLVPPIAGHSADANVDMASDADGVYWSDASTGRVTMWRAADDRVVPVGFSQAPFGVAASGLYVYWTDSTTNKLYFTAKPAIALP